MLPDLLDFGLGSFIIGGSKRIIHISGHYQHNKQSLFTEIKKEVRLMTHLLLIEIQSRKVKNDFQTICSSIVTSDNVNFEIATNDMEKAIYSVLSEYEEEEILGIIKNLTIFLKKSEMCSGNSHLLSSIKNMTCLYKKLMKVAFIYQALEENEAILHRKKQYGLLIKLERMNVHYASNKKKRNKKYNTETVINFSKEAKCVQRLTQDIIINHTRILYTVPENLEVNIEKDSKLKERLLDTLRNSNDYIDYIVKPILPASQNRYVNYNKIFTDVPSYYHTYNQEFNNMEARMYSKEKSEEIRNNKITINQAGCSKRALKKLATLVSSEKAESCEISFPMFYWTIEGGIVYQGIEVDEKIYWQKRAVFSCSNEYCNQHGGVTYSSFKNYIFTMQYKFNGESKEKTSHNKISGIRSIGHPSWQTFYHLFGNILKEKENFTSKHDRNIRWQNDLRSNNGNDTYMQISTAEAKDHLKNLYFMHFITFESMNYWIQRIIKLENNGQDYIGGEVLEEFSSWLWLQMVDSFKVDPSKSGSFLRAFKAFFVGSAKDQSNGTNEKTSNYMKVPVSIENGKVQLNYLSANQMINNDLFRTWMNNIKSLQVRFKHFLTVGIYALHVI